MQLTSPAMQRAWQHVHPHGPPRQVESLSGAWTSRPCVLAHGERGAWVIKLARSGDAGLQRARYEYAATLWAHGHGLAPQPVWLDPQDGTLVLRYVAGSTPWSDCPNVIQRLRQLHGLPAPAWPRLDPWALAQTTLEQAAPALQPDQQAWLRTRLNAAKPLLTYDWAPSHNDVQPLNVVHVPGAGAPMLIDWEEAALAPALWDVASWITSLELPASQHGALLAEYGRPNAQAALAAWCAVAQVYFLTWGVLRPAWRNLETARLQRLMQASIEAP